MKRYLLCTRPTVERERIPQLLTLSRTLIPIVTCEILYVFSFFLLFSISFSPFHTRWKTWGARLGSYPTYNRGGVASATRIIPSHVRSTILSLSAASFAGCIILTRNLSRRVREGEEFLAIFARVFSILANTFARFSPTFHSTLSSRNIECWPHSRVWRGVGLALGCNH